MKKLVIFTVGLLFFGVNICSYGQELKPKQGTNGKYGFVDETGKVVIPFEYHTVENFYEGLAAVQLITSLKWGFIDETGKVLIPFEYSGALSFSEGLAAVVRENKLGFIDKTGKMVIPPTYDRVQNFSEGLATVRQQNKWGIIDKTGKEVVSMIHESQRDAEIAFKMVRPEYDAREREKERESELALAREIAEQAERERIANLPAPTPTAPRVAQTISTVNVQTDGISDVAANIPTTGVSNNKTFAVIIANENYRRESKVEFAQNDGETFRKYCIQTLGLPEVHVHYTADATLNDILGEINWLSDVADAFKDEANFIFYYAGHGIPDENSRSAYLLPVDGFGTDLRTGYKLDELYETLGKMPAKSVAVFLDACFSGSQRSGSMMASSRGVVIKVAQGAPTGNMVVFSAAQGDETAFPYREKQHGMFTYFLLKKLQESKGDVTLSELGDYIVANVRQQSIPNSASI